MPEKIISIYCFFDELLHAMNHKDDKQAHLSTAEIMTVGVVAAEFFTGNQQAALDFLISHRYIKGFSKSRFNRRLHDIPESFWQLAIFVLGQAHQQLNPNNTFIVDSFPVCRQCGTAQGSGVPQYQDKAVQDLPEHQSPSRLVCQ